MPSDVLLFWRSGRDSNPRGIAPKLISSQPRYDHFDTAADMNVRMCDMRLIRIPDFRLKIKRQPEISSGYRHFSYFISWLVSRDCLMSHSFWDRST